MVRIQVNLAGQLLFTVEVTGYQIQQRYGRELVRHAEHWRNKENIHSQFQCEEEKFIIKAGQKG